MKEIYLPDGAPTKKGRATRERIYEASISLIGGKGYNATTLQDICREADISIGTFYHHFRSKKDILACYVREESRRLKDYYAALDNLPRKEALLRVLRVFFGYFRVKGPAFVSAFLAMMLSSEGRYFRPENFSLTEILEDCLRSGLAAGEFSQRLPLQLMRDLATGCAWNLMIDWCTSGGETDLVKAGAERFEALLGFF